MNDERVLPSEINTANLEHFIGVKIHNLPEVFCKKEKAHARKNQITSRLESGPIASGGFLKVESKFALQL